MTASEIARSLHARRMGRGKWMAKCPAHDDRSASLSITEMNHGKTRLHCFSGCEQSDVLRAAGMTWKDLRPDGPVNVEVSLRVKQEDLLARLWRQSDLVVWLGTLEPQKRQYWKTAYRRIQGEIGRLRCKVEPEKVIAEWRERMLQQKIKRVWTRQDVGGNTMTFRLEEEQIHLLRDILWEQRRTSQYLARLDRFVIIPQSIKITIEGFMANESVSLAAAQTVTATAAEVDAAGLVFPIVSADITWSIDNTSVATVETNADGSATVTAVSAGTANLTVTDTKYNLTDVAVVTVTAPADAPVSISIVFGSLQLQHRWQHKRANCNSGSGAGDGPACFQGKARLSL